MIVYLFYPQMIAMIATIKCHICNTCSYLTLHRKWKKNPETIQKKEEIQNNPKKIFIDFLTFSLPTENPPEDQNSGIWSFTGPDRPGSDSKTTGRTGISNYSPAKRPGQPEINFTGFLDTLVFSFVG